MNSMKRHKGKTLKDELPKSLGDRLKVGGEGDDRG